jgi:hypothetical protein
VCFLPGILSAQKSDTSMYIFRQAENELASLQSITFHSRKEDERFAGNRQFIALFDRISQNPKIIDHPFSSLKDISVLRSPDGKLMLLTWNIHKDDGTHAYFGYLFVNNTKRVKKGFLKHENISSFETFRLIDKSALVKSPESYTGTPDKWFGMLYTQLIPCDGYYTLIGWDGNDKLTQRKFVDVLWFRSDGTPVFGKDVFKFPRKNPRRLMFEYSSDVTMSMKYLESRGQIVYSHLASRQPGDLLEGQFQYYGPDGSFDALELRKDRWVTIEDVDARNEKSKTDSDWNNPRNPDEKKHKKIMPQSKKGK